MASITVAKISEINYAQYDELLDFPHLYNSVNDDIFRPGITLKDALTCPVTWNRNEYPTLQMTYPCNGSHMIEIQQNRWIMQDCGFKFPHQLFKITHVTQELDQVVVSGEHIAAVLNDCTVSGPIQFANASAQDLMNQVLNTMQPQKDFTFDSKVSKVSNVNVEGGQQAGAILINPDQEGDQAVNSVLGLYGGELEFDNTEIHHSEHAGIDTGIVIDYGKNMKEFQHDISTENMWTGAVFIAKYTPGQAVAKADWGGWASWSSDYSSVGIYAAGGTVEIFNSPVEGHQAIRTLTTGMKLHLGTAIHDGDFTPDGKYQINTVNGDDWYPVSPEDGSGFVDARWISFDKSGSYMVNDITGTLTVQAQDPNDSSGAGSRISMSGNAVVAYKPGGEIRVFKSPEIGPDHVPVPGWTVKNGTSIHYDMIERNQKGDMWYRIGPGQWLYGPHLSLTQNGSYQSYSNSGYGYIKKNQTKYHWDSKNHKMVATTHTVTTGGNSKNHRSGRYWASKKKKEKVHVKSGRVTIDKTIVQGGKTYHHTKYGWVAAGSIDYKHNGSVKPSSTDQILKDRLKDHSKVEIYATPDKNNALNWSIPSGTQISINAGHEAKGGDGKTYVEVTYAGKTGWLPEDNIDSDKSDLVAPDANDGDDSSNPNPNIDATTHNEVTVKVGPLYAEGFGNDPNVDKVTTVDVSSYIKHDDQDLSGQQADGSFAPTEDDIRQVTEAGKNYLIEHRFGHLEIQDTISYQEMSAMNADKVQLSLYDYVHVKYDKYHLDEMEEINSFVWDGLAHHYQQITIGKLPVAWQHLLLQQAKDQAASAAGAYTKRTQGWLNRFEDMMHSERSDRRAKENAMMGELGMIQQDVTWKDDKGKEHKLKDVFLKSRKEFEEHFQQLDDDANDIKSWIDQPGEGIIQAIPNWQAPQQLTARSSNGGKMVFGGNGLEFYDERSQKLLTGMDSRGKLYADSIEGVSVKAMNIDAMIMHGNLVNEDPNMNMKIYIGTQNPGTTLNPWKNGRVIWVTSDNYASMMSSGQFATTSGSHITRIHPSAITVDDEDNQVLTQRNFAGHAYRRIKSWVRAWVADWITIRGTKHWIWKGSDNVDMGKLRDLPGQGRNDYRYIPGSNDDWGSDEAGILDGIDLGSLVFDSDLQGMNQQWQNAFNDLKNSYTNITVPSTPDISTNPGQITTDVDSTSSKAGMLNYTEAYNRGLGPKSGHYTEAVGTMMGGNDGHMYVLKLYTPTGNKHWYRVQ
ncbi:phage tail spike protein [uncultured Lactobacillus sp.]|uniref:phage tail spike protein n=1 Tax=uncultured Lactobacillus sp. TaxID=153152 RepID=UPI00260B710A|nr:phage tail spike protein [uncultured Lactobacillus sp.]